MGWKPEDYIVAGLAVLIISGTLVRVYGVVFQGVDVSSDTARIVENLLSSIVAVISMYIGAKIQRNRDKDD